MEAWREELDRALVEGLEDSDDGIEDHLLEDIFLNLNFDPDEEKKREHVGSRRAVRRYP